MGQSSSQAVPQFEDEPKEIDKQERRRKSKKRKEKRLVDVEEHAEEEEEIAQTLLEMQGSQAREDVRDSDDNDIAAAHQLLAESSPARRGTSTLVRGGPVRSRKTSKAKAKGKKNKKSQEDQSTGLGDGAEVHNYVEDLLGTKSRATEHHVNGSQRDPHVVDSSSMAVPSLDDMDSNDENIAPYLREYDRLSAIAEPTTPIPHDEGGPDHERTSPPLTSSMGEKRKRKRRRDDTRSAVAVTDSADDGISAETAATHQPPGSEYQANGISSLHRPHASSDAEQDVVMESIDQRQVSPDLYNIPLDPVLPGIEDPTSPAYKGTAKKGKRKRKRARDANGEQQPHIDSFVSVNQDPDAADPLSQDGLSKPPKRVPSKRKRPVPADDSAHSVSKRPKKKRISLDYKTAQLRKVSQGPGLNGIDEGPREGPFTDAEIARLFAFRDQWCEENDCTQQQFIAQIHANAHNNVKNIGFWNEVSEVLPYRTRHSLQRVCRRRFHNFTKRGIWTAEEDEELREAHAEHGNRWKVIGEQIERLPEDCRDRWRNYLKQSEFRNRDEWTEYEVDCLKSAVAGSMEAMRKADRKERKGKAAARDRVAQQDGEEKDTINWVIVSAKLGGSRSRLQCSYKWKQLGEKAKNPEKNSSKDKGRGSKKTNEWRKKRPKEKFLYMLPGDKYEILNALSQLSDLTDESEIVWRNIGDDSFRSVWTAADCKYAYSQMKESISGSADVMDMDEIINTLKEKLEEKHPDDLDMHWVPTAKGSERSGDKTKSLSKSKKPKKQKLSTETVEESDLDNSNNNPATDARNGDSSDASREQTPSVTPEPDQADSDTNQVPNTQPSPEVESEAETDSNPASSDVLDSADDADTASEPEPEIADSDQEGRTRTRTRTSTRETSSDDDESEDDDVSANVDEQLASKVMLLRDA